MNYNRHINTCIVCEARNYRLTELLPNDHDFKLWATRETLTKYWLMGMRGHTKWDAK